jgi:hypothetical protein
MERLIAFRKPILALLLIAMALSLVFTAVPVQAAERTFKLTVVHAINGQKIGLAKELPVDIKVYKDGKLRTTITDLKFGEKVTIKKLPAGMYKFEVFHHGTTKIIASMTTSPVLLKGGTIVRVRAVLNYKKVPILKVVK